MMNEKLKKLAEQAGMEPDMLDDENEGIIWWIGDKDLERLIKLIVKDCANQVSRKSEALSILEYFGVE